MADRIIVFSPNPMSLYTTSVCELLIRRGYTIDTIVVRKFTLNRFRQEYARDGKRLLVKIWRKLILRESAYSNGPDSLATFRKEQGLVAKHVNYFIGKGTKVIYTDSLNSPTVEQAIGHDEQKLIVFTGGGIVRKNILDRAGKGVVNCHMGVLPRYRGMDLPEWCILENNMDALGITVHIMDNGIDTGPILRTEKISAKGVSTIRELRNRYEPIMISTFVQTIDELLRDRSSQVYQNVDEGRQYFKMHDRLQEVVREKLMRSNTKHQKQD